MIHDAVIVGGGLSGLAAAVRISAAGGRVALVEQSPRPGGRCYSYRDRTTGETVDNGQHVLLGSYRSLLHYLSTIGTGGYLRAEPSLTLPFHHPVEGFATLRLPRLPAPLDLTAGILTYGLLGVGEKAGLLRAGRWLASWSEEKERSIAGATVGEWLDGSGQSERSRRCFWDPIALSVMNERPGAASALLFARALRMAFLGDDADSRMLIPTIGQSELYVAGALRFLESRGSVVMVNAAASGLVLEDGRAAGIRLRDGTTLRGGAVISGVPPWALPGFVPQGERTAGLLAAARSIAHSPIVSVNIWFDREFMEGDLVGLIGKTVQWAFNRRSILPEEKGAGACVACVISAAYDVIGDPAAALVATAARELREVFPAAGGAEVTHSVVIKEKRATFSATPETERARPGTATAVERFYLAGDWTDTGLPATIEGAVISGYRAADLVRTS